MTPGGGVAFLATFMREEPHMVDTEETVAGLVRQLENPHLKPFEIEAIKDKIKFLEGLESQGQ